LIKKGIVVSVFENKPEEARFLALPFGREIGHGSKKVTPAKRVCN
jgi:hypothetical protein